MTDSIDIGEKLSESELCPDDLLRAQEEAFARDIERLLARSSEFVDVACPACGSTGSEQGFPKYGFTWVRCTDCRTLYMSPRPSPEVMGAYYSDSENYRFWAQHIFPASEQARKEKIHRPWLERVVESCRRQRVPLGTLLEIGPGFGTFAALATESGFFERVVAVEPTPELVIACRSRGVEVVAARVEDVADEIGPVDVVVAFEAIEHLFEPGDLVRQAARFLAPGGLLVLSCPNGEGFDIATLGPESLAVDPEHVNLFNPQSLGRLLDRFGFDVVESATPGRLDAEFVRTAALEERYDLSDQRFLQRVLIDEWERLGWPFQCFLAENGLSSHMWLVAQRRP